MKLKAISSITLLSALSLYSTLSIAGEDACPQNAVHCAYVVGLSNNVSDGRYIKVTNEYGNFLMCFTGDSAVIISQFNAGKFIGTNNDTYFICADADGKKCQQFTIDTFKITKEDNDTYKANPARFAIDVSKLKNYYPTCNAFQSRYIKR